VKFFPRTIDRVRSLYFGSISSYVAVLRGMFVLIDGYVKAYSCRGYEFFLINSVTVYNEKLHCM